VAAQITAMHERAAKRKEDARRAACFPDLLEALQAADVYVSHMPNDIAKDLLVIAMRAAIKKARGESLS
jgi:hypothetical protein